MMISATMAAVIALGLAALGGLTLAVMRLRGMELPPTWMAVGHGVIAATGLVLLIYAVSSTAAPDETKLALAIIVLAALGGAGLFFGFHMRARPLPIPFVIAHGLIAAVGYGVLLLGVYRG